MNKFWKFVNKVSGEGSSNLYLEGEIASETWWGDEVTPEAFRTELRQMKGDLTVHLNSPGGDVFAGVAIYNALKDYTKGKVVVKVDGLAASIASVVAMAGDEIIMSPGSMMMIHNPWSIGVGSSDELRKAADTLDQIKDSILPIYTDRSGLSEDEVKDLMDAETWMTAEKAVELGFADTVQKATKDEKETVNLMYSNFAFSMSATKSAMKDFINKFNNSERETSMNENDELKETQAEVETEETKVQLRKWLKSKIALKMSAIKKKPLKKKPNQRKKQRKLKKQPKLQPRTRTPRKAKTLKKKPQMKAKISPTKSRQKSKR